MSSRGWEQVTAADVAKMGRQRSGKPSTARSKYGAVKTTVDGIVFDSAKEAKRYGELKLLEKAGEIKSLCTQPSYCCEVAGKVIGTYRADFAYFSVIGKQIVEDVKGFKTPLYRWKKKHVEAQYGIEIREI